MPLTSWLRHVAVDLRLLARCVLPTGGGGGREVVLPSGAAVRVCPGGRETVGTGGVLWPSGLALAEHFSTADGGGLVAGKRVIELGSGCGLVGIAAAVGGAEVVVLTDLPSVPAMAVDAEGMLQEGGRRGTGLLRQLDDGVDANRAAHADAMDRVKVRPLEWGNTQHIADIRREFAAGGHAAPEGGGEGAGPPHRCTPTPPFDVVLAADVLYDRTYWGAFLETVAALAPPATHVVVAMSDRGDVDEFKAYAAAFDAARVGDPPCRGAADSPAPRAFNFFEEKAVECEVEKDVKGRVVILRAAASAA